MDVLYEKRKILKWHLHEHISNFRKQPVYSAKISDAPFSHCTINLIFLFLNLIQDC